MALDNEIDNLLEGHSKVIVSGCDIDGIPRGKTISAAKFSSALKNGFGFCSVVFAWDCLDALYSTKPPFVAKNPSYPDVLARIDPSTKRKIPATNNIHFLIDFCDPYSGKPLPFCPRSLLRRTIDSAPKINNASVIPLAGIEYEWYNYRESPSSIANPSQSTLKPLSSGMFGYSLLRPQLYQDYFQELFDTCAAMNIPLEGLHTETGPGVLEAAITYTTALELADRAHLFKLTAKQIALSHQIMACFMAKPYQDLPGCSGHVHISLKHPVTGKNLFAPDSPTTATDISSKPKLHSATSLLLTKSSMSTYMQQFVAGLLEGLPSIMCILAPNPNSYKRLDPTYWAPNTISYGFETRTTSIRIIIPPHCDPESSRIEVRVPGSDVNPYLALASILACGFNGIVSQLDLKTDPCYGHDQPVTVSPFPSPDSASTLSPGPSMSSSHACCQPLPRTMYDAIHAMSSSNSVARQLLGNDFVDHYIATRLHELREYERSVTDYELKRYMETA